MKFAVAGDVLSRGRGASRGWDSMRRMTPAVAGLDGVVSIGSLASGGWPPLR